MRKCDIYLTLFVLVGLGALPGIERLGVDRWTIISGPTLTADLVAGTIGFAAAIIFFSCSLSPRSGNTWALKNASLRTSAPGQWFLRASIWVFFVFLTVACLAMTYIRVASEYLPGIDFSENGEIVGITKATRWQNPCDRTLDVVLKRGPPIHFCQVTAWGQSIGPDSLAVGDRVVIYLRNTRYFVVVKNIASTPK